MIKQLFILIILFFATYFLYLFITTNASGAAFLCVNLLLAATVAYFFTGKKPKIEPWFQTDKGLFFFRPISRQGWLVFSVLIFFVLIIVYIAYRESTTLWDLVLTAVPFLSMLIAVVFALLPDRVVPKSAAKSTKTTKSSKK